METRHDLALEGARPPEVPRLRPRVVLALGDGAYADSCDRHFARLGWDVHRGGSGEEARQLAQRVDASVVVVDTELPGQSGWLTCSKLVGEQPGRKVVLVATRLTVENQSFASFVGAAGLVLREDGVQALVDEIQETALLAAG
jgi:DNA-binding response OmpR family regulator